MLSKINQAHLSKGSRKSFRRLAEQQRVARVLEGFRTTFSPFYPFLYIPRIRYDQKMTE
jgi:hypothetical protein